MKYEITNDKIIIFDKNDFNATHILECGQIFRYKKQNDGSYNIISGNKTAKILETPNCYEIRTKDVKYFENFFDLNTDYTKIKNILCKQNETLKKATNFGNGIRILNQPPFEMIISFIISANNNIKRIQSLVEKLSKKCGKNMGEYYAFPTLEELIKLSIDDLKQLGMGFRAKYIYETTKKLQGVNLENMKEYDTTNLLEYLSTLSGVGPKVADCIALFGYHKMDCFPVDTWVEKIYNCYFSKEKENNRVKIRKNLVDTFGDLSGYAQQYLFYYKRELDKTSKSIN